MRLFVPGNVPRIRSRMSVGVDKENGQVFRPSVKIGQYLDGFGIRRFSMKNKKLVTWKKRRNKFADFIEPLREHIKYKPQLVGLHFVWKPYYTRPLWMPAAQLIVDLLVIHGVFEDETLDNIVPSPLLIDGKWYTYNVTHPGVIIEVSDWSGADGK